MARPISAEQRQTLLANSIVAGVYEKMLDRESAFEKIKGRTETRQETQVDQTAASRGNPATPAADSPAAETSGGGLLDSLGAMLGGGTRRTRSSAGEQLIRSAASSIGREVGRQIIRGVLGGIFGGGKR